MGRRLLGRVDGCLLEAVACRTLPQCLARCPPAPGDTRPARACSRPCRGAARANPSRACVTQHNGHDGFCFRPHRRAMPAQRLLWSWVANSRQNGLLLPRCGSPSLKATDIGCSDRLVPLAAAHQHIGVLFGSSALVRSHSSAISKPVRLIG